jgi:hypothetical protein
MKINVKRSRDMKKSIRILAMATVLTAAITGSALATPSTQIWIPSTDIRDFKQVHLDVDAYLRTSQNGVNTFDTGVSVGVLPFEKLKMEIGADYIVNGDNHYDSHPLYFHAKLGTPEGSLFTHSPALAVGGFGIGIEKNLTNQNVIYALAAKTLPVVGRISAGYFHGNNDVLTTDHNGYLLSWDRTLSEISDKLWAAVDYQSGKSGLGALSFGFAWSFTPNISLLVGYDVFNAKGSADTFTTQLDINIP